MLTKDELEEVVDELSGYKGRHTELISVYISAGYDAIAVQKQLEAEKSTAKNIKSTSTRKNVGDALDRIIREIKEIKRTPENGMALFSGNVSEVEGRDDFKLWVVEPPKPLKVRLYRCDKDFVLEPLREQLEVDEVYGLLVMDRKEATIGILEGKRIEVVHKMTSGVPSKVRAGGQCLSLGTNVYLEDTKIINEKYLSEIKVGEKIKALNLHSNQIVFTKVKNKWEVNKEKYLEIVTKDVWSILASEDHTFFKKNNGKIIEVSAKDLKINDDLISFDLENKIIIHKIGNIINHNKQIKMIDIETEEGNFFAEGLLVHNSSQRFHRITEGLTKEFYKRIAEQMKEVFFNNEKLKGIIVGGPVPTKDEFLDNDYLPTKLAEKLIGRVDIGDSDESGLKELVAKSYDLLAEQESVKEKKILEKFFETLGENPELALYKEAEIRKALEYGAVSSLLLSKDLGKPLIKELKNLAQGISASVEIISTETEEGKQFKNLSGIGALLRFRLQ